MASLMIEQRIPYENEAEHQAAVHLAMKAGFGVSFAWGQSGRFVELIRLAVEDERRRLTGELIGGRTVFDEGEGRDALEWAISTAMASR